jgi:hypothetical protein
VSAFCDIVVVQRAQHLALNAAPNLVSYQGSQ